MRPHYPVANRTLVTETSLTCGSQHPALQDPVSRAINDLNRCYDHTMYTRRAVRAYGGSDFHNYGYWHYDTFNLREACENLMHVLLGLIPNKGGTLLDVACGKGASTRFISKHFPLLDVTAINISEKQLHSCRNNAPSAAVLAMDAARLGFQDNSFDTLICVEAAFHFRTREKSLKEALRVLRPGGHLVLSDVLASRLYEAKYAFRTPRNYLRDPHEYRNLCLRVGFEDVHVIDATDECWISFYRHQLESLHRRFLARKVPLMQLKSTRRILFRKAAHITYYLLACLRKPAEQ